MPFKFFSAPFPRLTTTSLLASTAVKRLAIILVVLTTLYYFQGESIHVLWKDRVDAHLSAEYDFEPAANLPPQEWGLWGREVARLNEWGTQLLLSPRYSRRKFLDRVEERFKFMKGTTDHIYSPWTHPSPPDAPRTGIVVCVGSKNYQLAAHLLANLRHVVGSRLPIEVAFAGDEDLRSEHREFLASLHGDLVFTDLLHKFPEAHDDLVDSGWAMKPFALLATSFQRAILLDADAIFFAPPDDLFESHPGLKETGALYYHDRAAAVVNNDKHEFLETQFAAANITPSDMLTKKSMFWSKKSFYEADSGLVALDKTRPGVFLGLVFTAWMNTKTLRQMPTYSLFWGDKETYWIADELASIPYAMPDSYAGSMGVANDADGPDFHDGDEAEVCGKHMLHLDHTGERPFWINNGILLDKGFPEKGYVHMTHYWKHTERFMTNPPKWWWLQGNVACLKEVGVVRVDDITKLVLDRTIEQAKKIDDRVKALSSRDTV